MKKALSVIEFKELVNHHSVGNIKQFRLCLRTYNIIKNNQPLYTDLAPVWEEICKVKRETGLFWVPAMEQVISNLDTNFEEPNEHQKMDTVISLLQEILVELRSNRTALNYKTVG